MVAHELLHLRVPNHGRLFKALMAAHVPGWRSFDVIRGKRPCAMSQPFFSGLLTKQFSRMRYFPRDMAMLSPILASQNHQQRHGKLVVLALFLRMSLLLL